jgi:hypothetical protein
VSLDVTSPNNLLRKRDLRRPLKLSNPIVRLPVSVTSSICRRTTIYGWLTRRILRRDEDLTVNECGDGVRSADAFASAGGILCVYAIATDSLIARRCSICTKMRFFPLGARAGRSGTFFIWGLAVYLLDGGVVRLLKEFLKARGVTPLNPKFAVSL